MKLLLCQPGASYSTADVYNGIVPALKALGHDVHEYDLSTYIDYAGKWLNFTWRETKRRYPDYPKPDADVIQYEAGRGSVTMALYWNVEWVVVCSGMYLHPDLMVMLRRGGRKIALQLTESPYDLDREMLVAPLANVVWTNERLSVPTLRSVNPHTYYLPHAYDPAKHQPGPQPGDEDVPAHDVVFVGTAFRERIELLSAIDWTGIDLGLYGEWSALGSRSKLRRYVKGGVTDNAKTAALYRRAKIGLNLYRQSVGFGKRAPRIWKAESLNPRAYELAACGVFQISDDRAELNDVFGHGAIGRFTTPQELEQRIRLALSQPETCRFMAGQALKAIRLHTWAARAEQMTNDLRAYDEARQRQLVGVS